MTAPDDKARERYIDRHWRDAVPFEGGPDRSEATARAKCARTWDLMDDETRSAHARALLNDRGVRCPSPLGVWTPLAEVFKTEGQSTRYPLLCWDTGDRFSEVRYKGPFNDEAEAGKYVETFVPCASDLWAGEGNLHESAWARWDESIVTTKDEASMRRALAEALAPHLKIDVFICEDDEEVAP